MTKHYRERFFKRQARTKRIEWFTQQAYDYGLEPSDFEYKEYEDMLERKEKVYGSIAKIYHGFIYWFVDNRAITIYPLPRKARRRWETEESRFVGQ